MYGTDRRKKMAQHFWMTLNHEKIFDLKKFYDFFF